MYRIDSIVQQHVEADLKTRSPNILPREADDKTMSFVYDLSRSALHEDRIFNYDSWSCAGSAGFGRNVIIPNDTNGNNNIGRQNAKLFVVSAGITYTPAGATTDSGKSFTLEMRLQDSTGQIIHLAVGEFSVSANVLHYYVPIFDFTLLKDLAITTYIERRIGTFPAGSVYTSGASGILRPSGSF